MFQVIRNYDNHIVRFGLYPTKDQAEDVLSVWNQDAPIFEIVELASTDRLPRRDT